MYAYCSTFHEKEKGKWRLNHRQTDQHTHTLSVHRDFRRCLFIQGHPGSAKLSSILAAGTQFEGTDTSTANCSDDGTVNDALTNSVITKFHF